MSETTTAHRDRMRRWLQAQKARKRCRCGKRIAKESVSRCLVCLERERRAAHRRRGTTTAGRKRRGRRMIGSPGERRREFERDERRRKSRGERRAERQPKRRI